MDNHRDSHQSERRHLYFPIFNKRTSRETEDANTAAKRNKLEAWSKSPPPIGLKLDTSKLVELVEARLNTDKKFNKNQALVDRAEKSKADHFPFLLLRIGAFEAAATNTADLVAKCYYGKRKLVWEILYDGLKNKIEIPWQDILAMRAILEENRPGILELELNRPPMFFHELDPKPRQHTLWRPTSDFTGGYASNYRRHFLEFPPGMLDKHYEKLRSDTQLLLSSQRPFPSLASPYFNIDFPSGYDQHQVCSYSQPIPSNEQLPIISYCDIPPSSAFNQSPSTAFAMNNLQDPTLAFYNQRIGGFANLSTSDYKFDFNDAELHGLLSNSNNFNENELLSMDLNSNIVPKKRHMENLQITYANNIDTGTKIESDTPQNTSQLHELCAASNANVNRKQLYSQLPSYFPTPQGLNFNENELPSMNLNSDIVHEERHMDNLQIRYANNHDTGTKIESDTPLNASQLQGMYAASKANVNEELPYSQPPNYFTAPQVLNFKENELLSMNLNSDIGRKERHMQNLRITCANNPDTSTKIESETLLNASQLQELYFAGKANVNEGLLYSQLPSYFPAPQVLNENLPIHPINDTLPPCVNKDGQQ